MPGVLSNRSRSRLLGCAAALVGGLWLATPVVAGPAAEGPALLFEPATGKVLYAVEPDRAWHPASVTKLLTAYLTFEAVQSGRIDWDSDVPLSEHARAQPATRIGLRGGIKLNVEQAVRGLILRSANDFATALAERIGGTEAAFVEAMNATARRLGMTRSVFRNPHGLPDAEQVTTARDLAILTRALLHDFPARMEVFATPTVRIHKGTFHSQNDLLRTLAGGDGLKTGFTCASGYNVVASATRDGRRLVAIVLGATHRQLRSQRATALLEAGFGTFGASPSPSPQAPSLAVASLSGSLQASTVPGGVRLAGHASMPVATVAPALAMVAISLAELPLSPAEAVPPYDMGRQVKTGKCRGYSGFRTPEADLVVSEADDEAGSAASVVTGALPGGAVSAIPGSSREASAATTVTAPPASAVTPAIPASAVRAPSAAAGAPAYVPSTRPSVGPKPRLSTQPTRVPLPARAASLAGTAPAGQAAGAGPAAAGSRPPARAGTVKAVRKVSRKPLEPPAKQSVRDEGHVPQRTPAP